MIIKETIKEMKIIDIETTSVERYNPQSFDREKLKFQLLENIMLFNEAMEIESLNFESSVETFLEDIEKNKVQNIEKIFNQMMENNNYDFIRSIDSSDKRLRMTIKNEEISLFRRFLQLLSNDELNIVKYIGSDNQSKDSLKESVLGSKDKRIYLVLNHLYPQSQLGHWILEVLVLKNINTVDSPMNTIYLFDSLGTYSMNVCLLKSSFPNIEVIAISDLPVQEYLDCGYWAMFYSFVIYHLLCGMSQIKEANPVTSNYFESIKNTI